MSEELKPKLKCMFHQEQQDYMKGKCKGPVKKSGVEPVKGFPVYCCANHSKYLSEIDDDVWKVYVYGSGSVVISTGFKSEPILRIYAPTQKEKYYLGEKICELMNGKLRNKLIVNIKRENETWIGNIQEIMISANGPYVDINPPFLSWVEDDSESAQNKRDRLIDYVWNKLNTRQTNQEGNE